MAVACRRKGSRSRSRSRGRSCRLVVRPSSLPQRARLVFFPTWRYSSPGQSRRAASQTCLLFQTCTRLHPVSPAPVLATA
jgi:hypothetical protein